MNKLKKAIVDLNKTKDIIKQYYTLIMRLTGILVILIIFISCQTRKLNEKQIVLENNLGILHIQLPIEFDSTYKAVHLSDCGPCCGDLQLYYYVNKHEQNYFCDTTYEYPENNTKPFSWYQFSISHLKGKNCNKRKLEINDSTLKSNENKMKIGNPNEKMIFSKIELINGNKFMIIATITPYFKEFNESLNAMTLIGNDQIFIKYSRNNKKESNFVYDMYKSLLTIKINKNNSPSP